MARSQEELKQSAWAAARAAVENKTLLVQWSGGRDSQTVMEVLAEMPEVVSGEIKLVLLWVDTRDAPQETTERFERWEKRVECQRIHSDSVGYRKALGDVADVVTSYSENAAPDVSGFQCCYMNISAPMRNYLRGIGAMNAVRGTRAEDNVSWAQSVQYGLPTIHNILWDWTEEELLSVIKDMPEFYAFGAKSNVDCMSCSAWVHHNTIGYVRAKNPTVADAVVEKVRGCTKKVLATLANYPEDFK